jgi:hypothetical protein
MQKLYAMCPITQKPIDAGFEADEKTIAAASRAYLHVHCPECSEQHRIRVSDLFTREQRS